MNADQAGQEGNPGKRAPGPPRATDTERERAVRLELLAQVGRRTTAILSLEDLLRSSTQIVAETFSYFMVDIFLVEGDDLVLRACTLPVLAGLLKTLRIRIGVEGITGWVAAHGQPLNVPDVRQDSRYRYELVEELQTKSELAVPILLQGSVIGVLDAQSTQEAAFGDLDVFTLQTVADQLAVAIENARLYGKLREELAARERQEGMLLAFHAAGVAMANAGSPEALLESVGGQLGQIGLFYSFLRTEEPPQTARLEYTSYGKDLLRTVEEASGRPLIGLSFPIERVPAFRSIAAGSPAVFIPAGSVEQSIFHEPPTEAQERIARVFRFPNTIVAPLLMENRLLGFLTVHSPDLGPQDIPALRLFADEVATAWRKAQLVRDLENSLRELGRAQEQLLQSQKMEAVGRLAGGVAHDFNNHLTAILGYTDLLTETLREDDPKRVDLGEIRKAALLAADLTRQLLAFSRKQMLQPRVVDFNVLVADMQGMLQRLISEDIRLETVLARYPVLARADPTQIQQVIMNLAVNARDAMPNGGALTIATQIVTDAGAGSGDAAVMAGEFSVIRVTDTGTGMDRETRSRLFEPFFTTKARGKGTGLGLSTAYGIVTQSGGRITCESEPGRGSVFTILLPTAHETLGPAPEQPLEAPKTGVGELVLVVEDEPAVRELVHRTLAGNGYRVLAAGTGREGLSLLLSNPVDLLLTDLVLPGGMSGLELARYALESEGRVRLLCVSGYSERLAAGMGPSLPPGALLQKPFTPTSLLARVREILDAG